MFCLDLYIDKVFICMFSSYLQPVPAPPTTQRLSQVTEELALRSEPLPAMSVKES